MGSPRRRKDDAVSPDARLAQFSLDQVGDAVYWIDKDARFAYVNEAACSGLGRTREELLSMHVYDIDFEFPRDRWSEHWEEVGRLGSMTFASQHRRASGQTFPVELTVSRVEVDGSEYNCAIGRDLTSRRDAEHELRLSEARLAAILEVALDCVITIDEHGRILEFNPAAESTFGISRSEALGQQMADLIVPPELRDAHREGMAHFLATGEGPVLDTRLQLPAQRSDGSSFPAEVAIHAIEIDGVHVFTAYLRDITESQATQAALERARDEAEAANRAKSEFLAHMSHEIRTPLTAIVGYSNLLQDSGPTNPEVSEWVEHVRRNSDYLLSLVNGVLDFSKIEAGQLTVEHHDLDITALIADIDALFHPIAAEKMLGFRVSYCDQLPFSINTDGTKLKQVLVNLVSNAVKFTEVGGVLVSVTAEDQGGEVTLRIDVADTGPGIDPHSVERVFDPFTREHTTEVNAVEGSGLGLSIARHYARALGGDVLVESALGQGSRFSLLLPVGRIEASAWADVNQQLRALRDVSGVTTAIQSLHDRRLLVVDDNKDNRLIVRHMLESAGAEVLEATNGQLALEILLDGPEFDAVLMDMQMPVMDGYTAVRTLREKGHDAIIVALTAFAMVGDRDRCLDAGCDGYLPKPVIAASLFGELERLLGVSPSDLTDSTERPVARVESERSREAPHPSGASLTSTRTHEPGFKPLLDAFLATLPASASRLREAVAANDNEQARSICHQLKGTGTSYGFPELTDAARACEEPLRSGASLNSLRAGLDLLQELLSQIAAAPDGPA